MLPPTAHPTGLTLRVRDPEAMLSFYRDHLGLQVVQEAEEHLELAPEADGLRLTLQVDAEAAERPHPSVGLYHLALLLPDRASLAGLLERLRGQDVAWDGFSDHGVSEALYLRDPEGNGVELYRDRPQDAWPRHGDQVAMVTRPLDVEDLLTESSRPAPIAPGTRLGHVHLHAGDLEASGAFYQRLGLRVTQDTYPGALFLAAGGYHHHVGLNAWARGRRAPEDATGLLGVRWTVPGSALPGLRERLTLEENREDQVTALDPDGHRVVLRAEESASG